MECLDLLACQHNQYQLHYFMVFYPFYLITTKNVMLSCILKLFSYRIRIRPTYTSASLTELVGIPSLKAIPSPSTIHHLNTFLIPRRVLVPPKDPSPADLQITQELLNHSIKQLPSRQPRLRRPKLSQEISVKLHKPKTGHLR